MAQSEKDRKIIAEAMKRFNASKSWESQARGYFKQDYRFANGDSRNLYQWDKERRNERDATQRPYLTINKTRQHCLQIINDGKQNKPSIAVKPTGGDATYESAQVLQDMIRHIEYRSNATLAYDNASSFQVQAGWGYWRVVSEYVDEHSFDQELLIKPIPDPLSIYIDPYARENDKSDMRFAFVFEDIPRDELEVRYPEYEDNFPPSTLGNLELGWVGLGTIRVAEYYRIVDKKDKLVLNTETGTTFYRSDIPDNIWTADEGMANDPKIKIRSVIRKTVEWYFIVGNEIKERNIWPGKYIPIVKVIGEEFVIDGVFDCRGHTRALLDPQKMYNFMSPLSLSTPIPTPNGWTTMGDVQIGDWVFDEKGKPQQVIGTSPVFINRQCFLVKFNDGTSIIADADHEWTVEERGKRRAATYQWFNKVIPTKKLLPKKHYIYVTDPLNLPNIDLPLDPYFLGAWLGDGTTSASDLCCHIDQISNMRENLLARGLNVGLPRIYENRGGKSGMLTVHGVWEKLRQMQYKHIPSVYLRASKEQRLELLRGLMDTDGAVTNNRNCLFTSSNDIIADGFEELMTSLGIKFGKFIRQAQMRIFPGGKVRECQRAFQYNFTAPTDFLIFDLDEKVAKQRITRSTHIRRTKRHGIVSITEIASVPVKCLALNTESHLFLAGKGMIPTHNSSAVEFGALQTKSPWLASMSAIEGYEMIWKDANVKNFAYLPYKSGIDTDGQPIPPPQRIEPPVSAPMALQGMQVAAAEMQMVSGQFDANMGEKGNERSGIAIDKRQRKGDNATYHYINNLAVAVQYTGKILLDCIPYIYDTPRALQIIGENGEPSPLQIDPEQAQALQQEQAFNGAIVSRSLNPKLGQYDVQADVGPLYATRRQEAFEALTLIMTQAPQMSAIIGDIMMQSADFPLAAEAAKRLKNMVPRQALGLGPSPEEAQLQQQVQQAQQIISDLMDKLGVMESELVRNAAKTAVDKENAITNRLKVLFDKETDANEFQMAVAKILVDSSFADAAHELKSESLSLQKMKLETGSNAPVGGR